MGQSARVGGGVVTGVIDFCAQCHNKAEVAVYPYHPEDNPDPNPSAICETCYRANVELELRIRGGAARPARPEVKREDVDWQSAGHAAPDLANPSFVTTDGNGGSGAFSDERARYLEVIFSKADDAFVERFISEVIVKSILKFDWKEIMKYERWFSVLDLRKFALELDPNFEKPVPEKKKRTRTRT